MSSFLFPLRSPRLVFLSVGCCLLWSFGAATVRAQDRLEFKNSPPQAGKIVGMRDGSVLIDVTLANGSGQMSYNLGLLARVVMAPPAAFQSGVAASQAGNWDRALADLKPLVDQFRGLPTDWAQQATGLLGDLYVEKKDLGKAEAAYNDYRRLYPEAAGGALRVSVGQARIAFARNNAAQARQQLQGITQAALKNPALVTKADGAAYGQAFYLLGQMQEQDHNEASALESYLRTVTLFYQDNATAMRAQQSADALRATHQGLTAP